MNQLQAQFDLHRFAVSPARGNHQRRQDFSFRQGLFAKMIHGILRIRRQIIKRQGKRFSQGIPEQLQKTPIDLQQLQGVRVGAAHRRSRFGEHRPITDFIAPHRRLDFPATGDFRIGGVQDSGIFDRERGKIRQLLRTVDFQRRVFLAGGGMGQNQCAPHRAVDKQGRSHRRPHRSPIRFRQAVPIVQIILRHHHASGRPSLPADAFPAPDEVILRQRTERSPIIGDPHDIAFFIPQGHIGDIGAHELLRPAQDVRQQFRQAPVPDQFQRSIP